MRVFGRQNYGGICCRISKRIPVIMITSLVILALSIETRAALSSQEDRYRVIDDSNNSGGTTGGSNSGGTNYGNSGGTPNSGNSVHTNNSNSGNRPKPSSKVKTVTFKKTEITKISFDKKKVNSLSKRVRLGTVRVKLPWYPNYYTEDGYSRYSYGGYLKFTAPKKRQYTFTVTDVKSKTNGDSIGYFHVMMQDRKNSAVVKSVKVSTKGGLKDTLWYSENGFFLYRYGKAIVEAYKTRTGKLNLQAGQTVYLFFDIRKAAFTLIIR